MVEGDGKDGDGNVAAAKEEADADEDAIGEVVEAVAEQDGSAEAVVNATADGAGRRGTVLAGSRQRSSALLIDKV